MKMEIIYVDVANAKNIFMVINADHYVKNVLISKMRPKIGHNVLRLAEGQGIELLSLGSKLYKR